MKKVYICNGDITGVFSAVYDSWKTKLPEDRLGIALKGMISMVDNINRILDRVSVYLA